MVRIPHDILLCMAGFLMLVAGIVAPAVYAADPEPMPITRSGCEVDYPPFCIVHEDGRADGFSVELLRATLARMGREVSFRTGPWTEVRGWLERGEVDVLPLVGRTPEREELFDFTVPYLTMHGAIVVRDDTLDVRSLTDLRGRRVGVMKGDNAEEYLRREERGFEIVTTTTFTDAFLALAEGRCDAVVVQSLVAMRLLAENGSHNLRIVDQPILEFAQDFCFAVKEGDRETLALLNEGLALVVADGTHRSLYAQWFAHLELPTHRPIVIGGDHNYPPFEFLDEKGRPAGYNVDMVRAVADAMGLDIRIRLGSWPDMIHALERGEIDAVQGMFYSSEREKTFDFSQAHIVNHCVAVTGKGKSPPPSTVGDLFGKRIVVQEGDIMHEFCRQHGLTDRLTVVATQEDALRELAAGKHDCALVARMTAYYWIEREGWDNLVIGRTPLASPEYCFAVPHDNQALLAQLSEGLTVIAHSGEYKRIHEKWMGVYDDRYIGSEVLKYVTLYGWPLLLVAVLALLWSWSLRRQVAARTREVRQTAARLERSEGLLKAAQRISKVGGWEFDVARQQVFWTDETYRIHDLVPGEIEVGASEHVERSVACYAEADRERVMKGFRACVEKGIPYEVDTRFTTVHGRKLWVRTSGQAVIEDGRVVSVVGDIQDITDQKAAVEAVRRSEEQYRLLANNTLDVIWIMTLDARFAYINPAIEAMFGFTAEEWTGTGLWEHCDEAHFAEMKALIESEVAKGPDRPGVIFDTEMLRRDGSTIAVEIHGRVIFDEHGVPVSVQGVTRDISERKRHEARLAHLLQVLRAVRNVNQLITHEKECDALLRQACSILTETRGYRSAWIALYRNRDETGGTGGHGPLRAVAESGIGDAFPAIMAKLESSETPVCCQVVASRQGSVVMHSPVTSCVDCPLSNNYQNTSALAGPLRHGDREYGFLVVALPAAVADDPDERSLFDELAGDIGYALFSIELEQQRQHAEAERERANAVLLQLLDVARSLTVAPDRDNVIAVIRQTARALSGADGVTIVLRDGDHCHYVDEDAIEPLWKGKRFPIGNCISGWSMLHGEAVAIENIYADSRVPHDDYRPTFVKGLAIAPIRAANPVGTIGAYWKEEHCPSETEKSLLMALGNMAGSVWDAIETREALQRSEETMRAVFESAGDGILLADAETGRFIMSNRAIRDMLGYSSAEIATLTFADIAAVESRDDALSQLDPQSRNEIRLTAGVELRRQNGSVLRVDVNSAPFELDGRRCVVGIIRDITGRLALEAQLHQAQKMESIGRLAGGVAHDFNNMLTIILGQAQILAMKLPAGDPNLKRVADIEQAAERSANLTQQLLAFARKETIAPVPLNLNDAVGDLLKMLRRLIGEDIDLIWQPGANLWPIKMDPSQLNQILANLCVNARDAIAGVGKVTIETENAEVDEAYCQRHADARPGQHVVLAVSDDGHGMDRETLAQVFEPFFTTKPAGEGTGLGLATVYGVIRQNEGFVNVYSEPGDGTTFRIYLPRLTVEEAGDFEREKPPPCPGGCETVLLVEDEQGVRDIARAFLEDLGYRVLEADCPASALELVAAHPEPIHLLLTDVVMPGMSGRDLAQRLIPTRPRLKVLYMSGYTANTIAHRGVLDQGVQFISKPFTHAELANKVRAVLDGS